MPFRELVADAEVFWERASEASETRVETLEYRHATASVLFSFIAVESFINDMMADFASLPKGTFTILEQGFLQERGLQFSSSGKNAGTFELTNKPEYRRLEDKVLFLLGRVAGVTSVDKGSVLWQRFDKLQDLRNALTHPRKEKPVVISAKDAAEALEVAKAIIKHVADKVWQKPAHF